MGDIVRRVGPFDDFQAAILLASGVGILPGNRLVDRRSADITHPLPGTWDRRLLLQDRWYYNLRSRRW